MDGGGSFTQLDPTTIFPADAVGFCCDQIVQYVPSIDRFVWLLQGTGYRLATASPADVVDSNGTAWTYWNLTPQVFGQPAGTGFDYPDLSVGDDFLYMSWDAGFGCPSGCRAGFQVARTSLTGIQAGGTITIEFTDPPDAPMAWGSHLVQNTRDEIFWAGHNSNSEIRVFSLAENLNSYFWRDVGIFIWARAALSSTTPDGQNWLAGSGGFPGTAIIGGTRSGNRIWFALERSDGQQFPAASRRDGDARPRERLQQDPASADLEQQFRVWIPGLGHQCLHRRSGPIVGVGRRWQLPKPRRRFLGGLCRVHHDREQRRHDPFRRLWVGARITTKSLS